MSFKETIARIKQSKKKVLVVGFGISGIESCRFLAKTGIQSLLVDRQPEADFLAKSKFAPYAGEMRELGVELHFGVDGEKVAPLLDGVELVVLSPGVPLESSVVGAIKRVGIPYVSELELGVQLHGGRSVVVTGSNGKSTTVSLIHDMLRRSGKSAFLCGNVGTPVIGSDEILDGKDVVDRSTLVIEASSYQLESCSVLKPAVGVFLNISENHLERHGTLERYAQAKARMWRLQDAGDLAVFNADDAVVRGVAQGARATLACFGQRSKEELGKMAPHWAAIAPITGGEQGGAGWGISLCIDGEREEYDTRASHLLGLHNRYNMAAAMLAARRLGATVAGVEESLREFRSLEHRLEVCLRDSSRLVINDSKSTSVAATVAAYTTIRENFPGQRIVLMMGGVVKAGSWEPLLGRLREDGKVSIICFGKDGPLLASHCRVGKVACAVVDKVFDAARAGLKEIETGGIVLFSPGAASFDEFTDFEHRGVEFKRHVSRLAAEAG